jgi:hypothetical protein
MSSACCLTRALQIVCEHLQLHGELGRFHGKAPVALVKRVDGWVIESE